MLCLLFPQLKSENCIIFSDTTCTTYYGLCTTYNVQNEWSHSLSLNKSSGETKEYLSDPTHLPTVWEYLTLPPTKILQWLSPQMLLVVIVVAHLYAWKGLLVKATTMVCSHLLLCLARNTTYFYHSQNKLTTHGVSTNQHLVFMEWRHPLMVKFTWSADTKFHKSGFSPNALCISWSAIACEQRWESDLVNDFFLMKIDQMVGFL